MWRYFSLLDTNCKEVFVLVTYYTKAKVKIKTKNIKEKNVKLQRKFSLSFSAFAGCEWLLILHTNKIEKIAT